jgi:branched-subunit amino acid ABC-type transport system permease component
VSFTNEEWWGLIHGMGFGALFLLAFAGGLAGLYSLRPALLTDVGVTERVRRLKVGVVAMAVAAWGTVLTGTWVVYPWYRAKGPDSPRSQLLANPATADWHEFGMEWKEHIAWLAPILATTVAFIVVYYGNQLIRHDRVRRTAMLLYVLAFAFAAVAGAFGAFITKVAPVQ